MLIRTDSDTRDARMIIGAYHVLLYFQSLGKQQFFLATFGKHFPRVFLANVFLGPETWKNRMFPTDSRTCVGSSQAGRQQTGIDDT